MDGEHFVHFSNCAYRSGESLPYYPGHPETVDGKLETVVPRNATEMLNHLARPDTKDKMPGCTVARPCDCVIDMATAEAR